ncbi:MAG: tRNA (adenosine(37)-N6)-dimethylallyltransferase MiaA [Candidatus Dadabacteria bacterium]|nr:MAG: tRNA (adenosine(37)-N6)-dimethylallyltransferase MiaA [Candidatus Dadabacteria bacterium]
MVWTRPVKQTQPLLIVTGPTASGKSELAVFLARKLQGEVINIDSMQIYDRISIGSARISEDQMQGVRHHLFGYLEPGMSSNVSEYCELADQAIKDCFNRRVQPIFAGGTSMYITALLHGLADMPEANKQLRSALEKLPSDTLYEKLKKIDPVSASRLHVNDRLRIIRALEISMTSGKPASDVHNSHSFSGLRYRALILVLCHDRTVLYERINNRSNRMVETGIIDETEMLLNEYGAEAPPLKALGYAQTLKYIRGDITKEELIESIAMYTRRFAKRQMTFWRNEPCKRDWLTIEPDDNEGCRECEGFEVFALRASKLLSLCRSYFKNVGSNVGVLYLDAARLMDQSALNM